VLRRLFGPEREKVVGGWRRLHNLCYSPNIIMMIISKKMTWEEHIARMGQIRVAYSILVGTSEGNRPLERRRLR
jgi:hypothetical protein